MYQVRRPGLGCCCTYLDRYGPQLVNSTVLALQRRTYICATVRLGTFGISAKVQLHRQPEQLEQLMIDLVKFRIPSLYCRAIAILSSLEVQNLCYCYKVIQFIRVHCFHYATSQNLKQNKKRHTYLPSLPLLHTTNDVTEPFSPNSSFLPSSRAFGTPTNHSHKMATPEPPTSVKQKLKAWGSKYFPTISLPIQ